VQNTEVQRPPSGASLDALPLSEILPSIDGLLFLLGADGRIIDFRTGQRGELFLTPETFLGKTLEQVLPPEPAHLLIQSLHTLEPGKANLVEYSLPYADGLRFFEAQLTLLTGQRCLALVTQVTRRVKAEEALRESEGRLRQAARVSEIGIFDHDHVRGVIYWSPEQRRIYGWSADEPVTLENYFAQVHADDRAAMRQAVERAHDPAGDGIFDVEHRILRRDGEVRWLATRSRTEFAGEGADRRPVRTIGAVIDLTDRRRTEQALLEKEAAIAGSLNGLAIADLSGTLIYVNDAFLRMWGYEQEGEVVGRSAVEFWEDPAAAASLLGTIGSSDRWSGELKARRRDGSLFSALLSASLIRDADGRPARLVGSFVDITERQRAEAAVRASEERFRALIEEGSDLVMTFDENARFTWVGPAAAAALGISAAELTGRLLMDQVHPDDRPRVASLFAGVAGKPGATARTTARVRHRNGTWRTFDGIARNLMASPAVRAIVANARDITEQRQLEERLMQADKLESIGRLAGGIAHDFNNILTAILGYAEILQAEIRAGKPTNLDDIREIQEAGKRARDLTLQLLAFARRQVISPQSVDLNEVVHKVERMLRRLLGEDIQLGTFLATDLRRIHVDPSQIEQVILNLAVNARDAMPSGGMLTIETTNVTLTPDYAESLGDVQPGPYVMLAVTDTGKGIPATELPHIFEPFFTTKGTGEGTGLGLATVYGIVRQGGGHVGVYSEEGAGSTFKLYFPRFVDDGTAESEEEESVAQGSTGTETILLVEDDAAVRGLSARALREAGYEVLVAPTPADALDLSTSTAGTIHLLVTDVVMAGMSGKTLADAISALRPDMRILFVSGYTENTIVRHGVLEPGVHFLSKPFTPTKLREQVRSVLDGGAS